MLAVLVAHGFFIDVSINISILYATDPGTGIGLVCSYSSISLRLKCFYE